MEEIARANGIEICYETFGDPAHEPLLLIMGLASQMVHWDDAFCRQLAAGGLFVIRFDNRDVGRSTWFDGDDRIGLSEFLRLRFLGKPVSARYKIIDMAKDAIGLLDALGIRSAHFVGASMGGMIAQEAAISFPDRVLSLTSIMSTTSDPRLPGPTPAAASVLTALPATVKEAYVEGFMKTWKTLRGGASCPEEERLDRSRAERNFSRGINPGGKTRQLRAILASGSRKERLATVKAPTLVIHGSIDPMVRPQAGIDTAASIPGAELLMVDGMGHALPVRSWPPIIQAIQAHVGAGSRIVETAARGSVRRRKPRAAV